MLMLFSSNFTNVERKFLLITSFLDNKCTWAKVKITESILSTNTK